MKGSLIGSYIEGDGGGSFVSLLLAALACLSGDLAAQIERVNVY